MRKTGRAGISVPVGEAFVFDASYSRETRNGNKNTTFYGGPDYEVATPIDFVTDNFRFGGEFAKGRFFLSASVDFSKFKNDVPFVEIDNPERLEMANPTNGRASSTTPPSSASGCPRTTRPTRPTSPAASRCPRGTRSPASLSTGNMKMDTVLRELSTNPNLQTSATAPEPGLHRSSRPTAASRPSTTRSWPR